MCVKYTQRGQAINVDVWRVNVHFLDTWSDDYIIGLLYLLALVVLMAMSMICHYQRLTHVQPHKYNQSERAIIDNLFHLT